MTDWLGAPIPRGPVPDECPERRQPRQRKPYDVARRRLNDLKDCLRIDDPDRAIYMLDSILRKIMEECPLIISPFGWTWDALRKKADEVRDHIRRLDEDRGYR